MGFLRMENIPLQQKGARTEVKFNSEKCKMKLKKKIQKEKEGNTNEELLA